VGDENRFPRAAAPAAGDLFPEEGDPISTDEAFATPQTAHQDLHVEFPDGETKGQDHEWCTVTIDGESRRIRFHDYDEIYKIPGLYETLFYELLECSSPGTVRALLEKELRADGVDPTGLTVLDLGAGNGMVGEQLAAMGAGSIVGIDLIEEAATAAERDRPGTYDDYVVADLTELNDDERERLESHAFNALVTVAALGFGDIPPRAFAEAFNLVEDGGWVAFNIKANFLDDGADATGFSRLIARLLELGIAEERAEKTYRHRLSTSGNPLTYVALVVCKRGDIPEQLLQD
jgi:SAM-dependent methyltransferase